VKVLVTGATGLLGTEVVAAATSRGHHVCACGRSDLDVTDPTAVMSRVEALEPEVIVHCAAYTAVDGAEHEPDLAMRVNRDGARHVASAAAPVGARMVYVSTDYVFDGTKGSPYLPSDAVAPLSLYGRSKLAGESAVLSALEGAMVVRTCWLYGGARRTFLSAMLERAARGETLTVVEDEIGRPTWARNAAVAILDLLEHGVAGVWHVADGGHCSRADLIREALRLTCLSARVDGITSAQWGGAAARPIYSVLDLDATEAVLGRDMVQWRDALARFLTEESSRKWRSD
jgi:dTDP-4-dehydrorhamnose reductase